MQAAEVSGHAAAAAAMKVGCSMEELSTAAAIAVAKGGGSLERQVGVAAVAMQGNGASQEEVVGAAMKLAGAAKASPQMAQGLVGKAISEAIIEGGGSIKEASAAAAAGAVRAGPPYLCLV